MAPRALQHKARRHWENRWWTMLSVAVQDAVAASLLNDGVFRTGLSYDGAPDLGDVLADAQGGSPSSEFSRLPGH